MDRNLDAAYRATTYTAETPEGPLALHVGERNATLDRLLAARGVASWAYVTAHNPGSRPAPASENEARMGDLRAEVARKGYDFHEGIGVGEAWSPEPSLLILGMTETEAAALGRRFGQLAVVVGDRGGPARLLWLRPAGADGDKPLRL